METAHGGGAINIITKQQKESAASLSFRENLFQGGNHGQNLNAAFSHQISSNTAFSLNINGFNEQGYRDGDKDKGFFVNSKLYYDINDNQSLNVGYDYFNDTRTRAGYSSGPSVPASSNTTESKITRQEFNANYHAFVGDNYQFDALAYWQKQNITYTDNVIPTAGTAFGTRQTGSGFEDVLKGINLKHKFDYADKSYVVLGYEYARQDAKRNSIIEYSANPVPGSAMLARGMDHSMNTRMNMQKQSHSFYALDSHQFTDIFNLSGGARYEYSKYKTNRLYTNKMSFIQGLGFDRNFWMVNSTTPYNTKGKDQNNFALEITPNVAYSDTGKTYAKYERGFISPSPAQFISRGQPTASGANAWQRICGTQTYCSSGVDSETFDTFEIGVKDYLWDFYGFELALFYTKTSDEISYLGDPHSDTGAYWKYYNIDETTRYGVDLTLWQDVGDKLTLSETFNYVDAKISKGVNDGRLIPYVSKFKATAGLDYAWTPNFSTFVDLTYLSRAKDGGTVSNAQTGKMANNAWMKERFLTDIGANYTYKKLSVFAGIKNLFDYEYFEYQHAASSQYLQGDGRSYYVEFKYNF